MVSKASIKTLFGQVSYCKLGGGKYKFTFWMDDVNKKHLWYVIFEIWHCCVCSIWNSSIIPHDNIIHCFSDTLRYDTIMFATDIYQTIIPRKGHTVLLSLLLTEDMCYCEIGFKYIYFFSSLLVCLTWDIPWSFYGNFV